MRAIIHLGTYKTGSSSLQNLCWDNREALLEQGILYPQTGINRDRKIGMRHTRLIYEHARKGADAFPRALADEIESSKCDTIIVSSEALCNPAHLAFLNQFLFGLRSVGVNDLVGVGVFRNLGRYQSGHFREFCINQKNAKNYPYYLHKPGGLFDYLFILLNWHGMFGDGLRTLSFETMGDIRHAFFDAAGLHVDVGGLAFEDRSNVSRYDAVDAEICRQLNALGRKGLHSQIRDALDRSIPSVKEKKWTERFKGDVPAFSDAYIERFRELAGWNEEKATKLFDASVPDGEQVTSITDEIGQLISAALA